ncbi:uncharacterized [Tachysurus ichikawai]
MLAWLVEYFSLCELYGARSDIPREQVHHLDLSYYWPQASEGGGNTVAYQYSHLQAQLGASNKDSQWDANELQSGVIPDGQLADSQCWGSAARRAVLAIGSDKEKHLACTCVAVSLFQTGTWEKIHSQNPHDGISKQST